MPLVIPPFVQYQAPLIPVRGLWNSSPVEGDKYVNAEIDWLTTTGNTNAVQFALSGNSPVALSQIAAFAVDNTRCGSDVTFLFPDSGFSLVVAAHNSGIFPVITNALMFYAVALNAGSGDVTVLQILNSIPPPIPIAPSETLNNVMATGISLVTNATTVLIAPPVNGTLNTLSLVFAEQSGASAGAADVILRDGNGKGLWSTELYLPASSQQSLPVQVSGMGVRFFNGITLQVTGSTFTAGSVIAVNLYYSVP